MRLRPVLARRAGYGIARLDGRARQLWTSPFFGWVKGAVLGWWKKLTSPNAPKLVEPGRSDGQIAAARSPSEPLKLNPTIPAQPTTESQPVSLTQDPQGGSAEEQGKSNSVDSYGASPSLAAPAEELRLISSTSAMQIEVGSTSLADSISAVERSDPQPGLQSSGGRDEELPGATFSENSARLPQLEPCEHPESSEEQQLPLCQEERKLQFVKAHWSKEENDKLRKLAKNNSNWSVIASYFPGRSAGQCRQRWRTVLSESLQLRPWTGDEDELLAELHAVHGSTFSIIAQQMNGRSLEQCRDRWSILCRKATYYRDASLGRWTSEEDNLLVQLYKMHGTKWRTIATQLPGRTANSIRVRLHRLSRDELSAADKGVSDNAKSSFTPEEDKALFASLIRVGRKDWSLVAAHVPGRSAVQCRVRWKRLRRLGNISELWTAEEDETLAQSVETLGDSNWAAVACMIPGRTAIECKKRWEFCVLPGKNDKPWTEEEDEVIRQGYLAGRKAADIAFDLLGRSREAIRARYQSELKKQLVTNRAHWTSAEQKRLAAALEKPEHISAGGRRNWAAVASEVLTKNPAQCKRKYESSRKLLVGEHKQDATRPPSAAAPATLE